MNRWSGISRSRLIGTALLVGVVLSLGLALAWWARWPSRGVTVSPPAADAPPPTDPRWTFPTPYRNVRPDVQYVGDEACGRCHADRAQTYRQHPMGRSLAPVQSAPVVERFDETARNPFFALGFRYHVERRGERVFHQEALLDERGNVVAALEAEVHYVVGSSSRGRSYLINRDGHLFQSPITWYPQKQAWDLSPSYAQRNHHFARPITAECLFCHSNRVLEVEQTLNRFQSPIFQGHAIGCERCHGPGELHVRRHEQAEEFQGRDDTIVNPRHLAPDLREAVCQQCHLQGQYRVLRYGRHTFDYRPGLPLHEFLSVFVRLPSAGAAMKFVGHAEQMAVSRCFQASKGELGCISCHDPHQVPAPAHRVSYYRDRCLSCHAKQGCSLPEGTRRQTSKEDSCVDCHMAARGTEVPHTSIADHRILRQPEGAAPVPSVARLPSDEIPLVHFHRDLVGADDHGVPRDLAVALMDRVDRFSKPIQEALGTRVLPWLDMALQSHADDVEARNARAVALWKLGRRQEAADVFDQVLATAPKREVALHGAASLATEMDRFPAARGYWDRALEVNPYRQEFHYGLAAALAAMHSWGPAAASCQRALELQIADLFARRLLVRCYLELGERAHAREEFERLLALHPPDPEGLRRWFEERAR